MSWASDSVYQDVDINFPSRTEIQVAVSMWDDKKPETTLFLCVLLQHDLDQQDVLKPKSFQDSYPKARCLVLFQAQKMDKTPAKQNLENLSSLLKNARLHKAGTSSPNWVFTSTCIFKTQGIIAPNFQNQHEGEHEMDSKERSNAHSPKLPKESCLFYTERFCF